MQFNSINFMIFFPIVLMVYFVIPKKCREIWLLVTSYYFYMGWNPKYAFLIAASTFITYICSILVEEWSMSKHCLLKKGRPLLFGVCLCSNLAILGIFKYGNFILNSVDDLMQYFALGGGKTQI